MTRTDRPTRPAPPTPAGGPTAPKAPRRGGRGPAALLGLAAGALAVTGAQLLAALVDPRSSPVLATGSVLVDHAPSAAKDAAIAWFGLHDKQALLGAMAAVLALLCAGLGVLAARSGRAAVAGGLAFAVVGAAAAGSRPGADLTWLLPSLVAVPAATALLVALSRGRSPGVDLAGGPGRSGRRTVLAGLTVAAGAGVLQAAATGVQSRRGSGSVRLPAPGSAAPAAPPEPPVAGVTPWATSTRDLYRIDTALTVPRLDPGRWRLRIHGLVEREVELGLDDLLAQPLVERWITLTCVSNEVGGTLAGNVRWLGVPLQRLLEQARPRPEADMVLSGSADGWTASTPLAALTDGRDALLAVGMNGAPLAAEHGFPARLVVPGLYGYVSATKWVVDLEVTRFDRARAYWTDRGYAAQAPIRTASRIDVPRPFARVTAGPVAVAGVTWAQQRGIRTVEVRVDGGPWQTATLGPALPGSTDTWRQWSWTWQATPGRHTLQVAATDETGTRQPAERRTPRPDGATGWHSVAVTVG